MMTFDALVMVILATAAVVLAYTKLKCPTVAEEHRIAWLPAAADELSVEDEAAVLSIRR